MEKAEELGFLTGASFFFQSINQTIFFAIRYYWQKQLNFSLIMVLVFF